MKKKIKIYSTGFVLTKTIIVISLLAIALAVVIGSRQKRIKRKELELETQITSTGRRSFRDLIGGVTPTSTPILIPTVSLDEKQLPRSSASPTPLISPHPSPTPLSPNKTYQVTISEKELNTYLTETLVDPTQSTDNPIVSAKITLHEGMGVLKAYWEKGQTLTAEIHVTADGKGLTIKNINVTGAGLLTGLFEQIADDFLRGVINQFITDQEKLEQIEIKPDQLILHYQIGL